jgi:DNA-binding IclR family transcriptional regulator
MKESGSSQGVAAVDRALSILEAFREGEASLALAGLAQRTGLYKSTILRLAASLQQGGYLRRLDNGEFQLGPSVLRLGNIYVQSFRLEQHVLPVLRALVQDTGESGSFYTREGDKRLCLFRVDSPKELRDHVRVGDLLPLNRGAGGKVLLQFADGVAKAGGREGAPVVVTLGERQVETAAVAAPVFGVGGQLVGALSASGPKSRFTREGVERLCASVLRHARDLTHELGGDTSAFHGAR